jgi:hypothetical protein
MTQNDDISLTRSCLSLVELSSVRRRRVYVTAHFGRKQYWTMKRNASAGTMFLFALLLGMLLALSACGNDNNGNDDTSNGGETNDTAGPTPQVSDDAPDPAEVTSSDLTLINEWRQIGVPTFRGGEVLDFEPHASQVENAGTILLDGYDATPEEIIAFYRGALRVLGWEERRVSEREMTAESDAASLLVTVSVHDEQTLIMMMVTDRLDPG